MGRQIRLRVLAATAAALLASPDAADANALVEGAHGAVAAEHRLASQAGLEILRAGGNAVDAAVAASLVGSLVNPSSAGLGGGGFMVVYDAKQRRIHTLDYRESAPAAAARDMYVGPDGVDTKASKRGGLAVAVPGEAAGLAKALERFGRLTLAKVAEPAIRLAREGFVVEGHLASQIKRQQEALASDAALAAAFLHDDGSPYAAGETLVREDLATAFELLASEGAAAFYQGAIAREIVAAVNAAGGIITAEDLSNYRVRERPAVTSRYGDWTVAGMPPPSSGGGVIAEVLAILAPYDLEDLGAGSATTYHLLAEAMKAAFADRASYYGDPDFYPVPLDRLLSASHAASVRARFSARSPVPQSEYGSTAGNADAGTAHISVIDAEGNAVACTTSINTSFGAKVGVVGRGIVLNNTMDDFSLQPGVPNAYGLVGSEANSIAPGKRPLSSMSPTIVVGPRGAKLSVGGSGGPLIISATLQTLLNVLVHEMDVAAAIGAPRIHHQWSPDRLGAEPGVAEVVRDSLARIGHDVAVLPFGAAVQAVEVSNANGRRVVKAASDPRKGGMAAAW